MILAIKVVDMKSENTKCLNLHLKFQSHFMGISMICEKFLRSQVFSPLNHRRGEVEAERYEILLCF